MNTNFLNTVKSIAIFGSHGCIGQSFLSYFSSQSSIENVYCFSRYKENNNNLLDDKIHHYFLDITNEESINNASQHIPTNIQFDLILVTTGILHSKTITPEKSIRAVSQEKLLDYFAVNSIGPLLIAKYFSKFLADKTTSIFAALSARVGSISDNKLGGWYGYRASKAALNMFIKTLSIELTYSCRKAIVVGLHPGTVATRLSQPFIKNYQNHSIFSPDQSVQYLIDVLNALKPTDSGKCFAWDGSIIES